MLNIKIENIISEYMDEYEKKISAKWDIDISELQEIRESIFAESNGKKKPVKKAVSVSSSTKSKNLDIEGGCPHEFMRGKDEGKTCNSKPKEGSAYCGRHQKSESAIKKEKKKIPVAKKPAAKKTVASKVDKAKTSPDKKPTEKIIRFNPDANRFWSADTQLVFDSRDNIVVVGSFRNNTLNELTDDDIAKCEEFGFKYDRKLLKNLGEEIVKTNLQAENIENVLDELGLNDEVEDEVEEDDYIEEDDEIDEDDE